MHTRIYVDGYNFYYGCLKGTPYKWVDLVHLLSSEILPKDVSYSSHLIKYFTAEISEKAALDSSSILDQKSYHRALTSLYHEDVFNIIYGYFDVKDTEAYLIDEVDPKTWPKYCRKVPVWKLEEKQSDVNIAIESVKDALTVSDLEQIVFVTNDSDIAPAIKMIKELKPDITIGVVIPTRDHVRKATEKLTSPSDWHLSSIRNSWLKNSQMPRVVHRSVRTGKDLRKPVTKPEGWYGAARLVNEIVETLLPACKSKRANCWKWLNDTKPVIEGLPELHDLPINMLDNEEDANKVLAHAKAYADFKLNHEGL